jgi:uncharacterized protein DUF1918
MPANNTADKKTTATEKRSARKTPAKKATAEKATARSAAPVAHGAATTTPVKRGDRIVIDSVKVGAQPREGEVLQVINRDLRVSYRVKWADGNESLFSPALGSARFLRV